MDCFLFELSLERVFNAGCVLGQFLYLGELLFSGLDCLRLEAVEVLWEISSNRLKLLPAIRISEMLDS